MPNDVTFKSEDKKRKSKNPIDKKLGIQIFVFSIF
jgi:hypothetical protein